MNFASAALTIANLSATVNEVAVNRWVATENFLRSAVFCLVTASNDPAADRYNPGSVEKSNSKDWLSGPDL